MEPITIAVVLGSAALGAWALSSKKPAGAPGSTEVQNLADITTTTGPKGERVFLPESAKNLLVSLASATASMSDLQNPFMVEYAPIPGGQAVSPDKSAFGWVSSENKARSILAPLYAVTTAASTQRKFLRSVAPGTEGEFAGPNGIYAVLVYAGALARRETPPGLPTGAPGAVIPTPNAPPTPPAASVPGGPPAPGPAPTPGSPPPPFVPPVVGPRPPMPPIYPDVVIPPPYVPPPPFIPGVVIPGVTGPIATVVAASGANLRSSANGTKTGALARGSTVRIEADAGFAGGEQWKQIVVMSASPGSNGQVSPGTRAFVALSTLSTGGGGAVPFVPSPYVPGGLSQLPAPGGVVSPGDVAKVTAPSGANVRSTPNGTKTGALATGSTVKIVGDGGSVGGYVWKKIQVVTATAGSSGAPPGSGGYVATISLSATATAPGTSIPGQVVTAIQEVVAVEKTPVGGKLYVNLSSTTLLSSTYTTFASTVDTAMRNEPLTVVETPSLSSPKWVKVKRDKSGKVGYVSVMNVTAARPSSLAGSWRTFMPTSLGGRPSLQNLFEIIYENAPVKFQEIMNDKKLFREIVEMSKRGQPHPKLMEALQSAKVEMAARQATPSAAGYYVRSRPAYRRWY